MVNILLIGGMVLGLILIAGVATALRAPLKARTPTETLPDPAAAELDDRLRKLTMASPFASEVAVRPVAQPAVTPLEAPIDRPVPSGPGRRIPTSTPPSPEPIAHPAARSIIEQPLPSVPQAGRAALPGATLAGRSETQVAARYALPGETLGGSAPVQASAPRSEALDPLSARFSGSQRLSGNLPFTPPPADLGAASRRFELPGAVLPGANQGFSGPEVRPAGDRPGLPGTVASSLPTMPEARTGFSSPPPNSIRDNSPSVGGFRNELPGTVAGSQNAPALDIRAILRGEAGPRGALPPSSNPSVDPAATTLRPGLATGPLSSPAVSSPLGGKAFSSALLELRALKPDPEATSGRLNIPSAFPASERLNLEAPAPVRAPADDLDATHLMDDFDLPDAGFETHVFSTAELVDDEAILPPEFLQAMAPQAEAPASPSSTFTMPITEYPAEPPPAPEPAARQDPLAAALTYPGFEEPDQGTMALSDLAFLSPAQENQARLYVEEAGQMDDVVAVKLIAPDGSVILEGGEGSGDNRTTQPLAELIVTSFEEAGQRDLGELTDMTIESAQGVLVLTPIHGGAMLLVLLGNPARLGALRRHMKKPVANLRSLLVESSVS